MIDDILNETTTVSSYDISAREHVVREVRVVDLEREQMGPDADGLSDEDIAQIILARRQAQSEAAQQAEAAQALDEYARQALAAFDAGAISRAMDGITDATARDVLHELLTAVSALIRLGGHRGE